MATILSIDTDCLGLIFRSCSLRSQFNLLTTCIQFKACIEDIWRRDLKELKVIATNNNDITIHRLEAVDDDDGDIKNASLQDLDSIFAIVNSRIENLQYWIDSEKMLELLQKYPFDKLRSLRFSVRPENEFLMTNSEFIYQLMALTTKWKLKVLKLNFYDGPKLPESSAKGNFSHFEELEELVVNDRENILFQSAFNFMPKLKIYSLQLNVEPNFKEIARTSSYLKRVPNRKVVELTTCLSMPADADEHYVPCIGYHTEVFPSIRKLTIATDYWGDIYLLGRVLPKIDHYIVSTVEITLSKLMVILMMGDKLDTIEFKDCWSESGPITLDVDEVLMQRRKPITINAHLYDIGAMDERHEPVRIQLSKPTEFIRIVSFPTTSIYDLESMDFYEYILEEK